MSENLENKLNEEFEELIKNNEIDNGTVIDGICIDEKSQMEFDNTQKNKPPLTDS